jgi:thiosulfate dehydrogenase
MRTGTTFLREARTAPAAALFALVACAPAQAAELPRHSASAEKDKLVVQLCDGETELAVEGKRPGDLLSREEAQRASDALMRSWIAKQDRDEATRWAAETQAAKQRAQAAPEPAAPSGPVAGSEPGQPVKFSARDKLIWQREEKKLIDEGYKLYHSGTALGGTIGVSCDMCHPDGSNTHPETYPKFQLQLKKVALLRDMINWCIENPGKGKPLSALRHSQSLQDASRALSLPDERQRRPSRRSEAAPDRPRSAARVAR